jgi:hypothetical protein
MESRATEPHQPALPRGLIFLKLRSERDKPKGEMQYDTK